MEDQQINNKQLPSVQKIETTFKYFPFFNQKQPLFVLALIGIIFYCTALYNEYALDDAIVIHQNSYVLKGVKGIKDIMSTDAYDSFYRRMNATDQLQGGRYRPLAAVSYAVEQEIIGTYRTGCYQFVQDLNGNKILDNAEITNPYSNKNYEYNDFVDLNGDKITQENECTNCWDTNKNFRDDPAEDLNNDGLFNEVDCQTQGAFLRHFNNMSIYILACLFLYLLFSKHVFKENQDMAFLAALIFLIHPVHTEIVANIKGREDIFSVLFIALTFLFAFKFMSAKKISSLLVTGAMFLLALFSKEYGFMLIVLIPIAIVVFNRVKIEVAPLIALTFVFIALAVVITLTSVKYLSQIPSGLIIMCGPVLFLILVVVFFKNVFNNRDLNAVMITLYTIALFYLGIRIVVVGIVPGAADTELLNNPYLLANGQEQFASKVFVLLQYLKLTVFPSSLTCDYSYAQIAYRHYLDGGFIISLLVNLTLIAIGITLTIKRHVLGFALITYYLFLLLVTNFLFDIGAVMREGFLFHSSIGASIALAWLVITGLSKIQLISFKTKRLSMFIAMSIVVFLCAGKTWQRNWDWKNDVTLFLKDVKTSPNSVLVLGNAGARWIDLADTKEITGTALSEKDNRKFNDYNGNLKITDDEMQQGGFKTKREAAIARGIGYLKHAVELHPRYVNGYLNLGLASFKLDNDRDAIFYWKLAEQLYPSNPYLENYYRVYSGILNDRGLIAFNTNKFKEASNAFRFQTLVNPKDEVAWFNLGQSYYYMQKNDLAKKYWQKTLQINSHNKEAILAIENLSKKK